MQINQVLSSLNSAQYEAVTAPLGAVRVLAGAGSGKTRVLVSRIAWLIETGQCAPWSILAVTFTNKAALEMKTRLEDTLAASLQGMWMGTFHSLCHRFLRLHFQEAGLPQSFQVMDSDDQLRLCKRILKSEGLDEKKYPARMLSHFINQHKDEGRRAEHVDAGNDNTAQELTRLYTLYQNICNQSGLVDFSEILLRSLVTLRTNNSLLAHYQTRFQFILVDEFQDTNSVQYAWVKLLASAHQRLFVVGDDDQSIYGWRGARVENILSFDRDFLDSTTIRLEQNYRSTPAILEAANYVISKNTERLDKVLWTENSSDTKITSYHALDAYDEARFVIENIRALLKENVIKKEMAILYRSNAQSRVFEEFLLRGKIPYRVYGGLRFFDRSEIKDIMGYLRLMTNIDDDVSLERSMVTPPKGIGPATIDRIRTVATEHQTSLWNALKLLLESQTLATRAQNALLSFVDLIQRMVDEINNHSLDQFFALCIERTALKALYKNEPLGRGEDRIENLEELIAAGKHFISDYQSNLAFLDDGVDIASLSTHEQLMQFLSQTTLDSTDNQAKADEDCVQLMTLHSSKGLEFKHVYLVGMEEGLFPSEASSYDRTRLEEERRLAYVGITRAKERLFMSAAESRMIHGKTVRLPTSRFMRDIPKHLIQAIGPSVEVARALTARTPSHSKRAKQMESTEVGGFKLGQSVTHAAFGEGVILGFEGADDHARVTVRFIDSGQKVLVLAYAKLVAL